MTVHLFKIQSEAIAHYRNSLHLHPRAAMDQHSPTVEALIEQAEAFRTFIGLTKPRPTDRFFLVTGMTGAGKSSFISSCTGLNTVVSHGLYSCKS